MNVIHIMADGSIKESIEGIVIKEPAFYRILDDIMKKKKA